MKLKYIFTLVLSTLAVIACTKNEGNGGVRASSVVLSQDNVNLLKGESATLTATVLPASLGMGVTWEVLDSEYVSCNNGVLTALKQGVTYVVATSTDGAAKASCLVNVNPSLLYSVSLKNAQGQPISNVTGYPGMSAALTPVASDGKAHTYTWKLEDTAVASVSTDGVVTLNAVPSSDENFLYDAKTYLTVISEDGCGCKIPVSGNLLNGVSVGGSFYPAGQAIPIYESTTYDIAVLYQGVDAQEAIPADAIDMELSNTNGFTLKKADGAYTLTTGTTGGSSKLSITVPGTSGKSEIAKFKVDKVYPIQSSLFASTSSTLVYTWTAGVSASEDVSKAYTLTIYKDEDCTIVDQSLDIPANCAGWNTNQPRISIGGLQPSTTYWMRVVNTTDNLESNVVEATTSAFTVVEMPAEVTTTGVALAEDFGELRWDFDLPFSGAGYKPSSSSNFANTAVSAWRKPGDSGEMTFKGQGTALASSRLKNWITDTDVYIHPGYLKLGTAKTRGWIITPEFTVPEGKTVVVSVTITACAVNGSQDKDWAVAVLTPEMSGANPSAHTASFDWPDVNDKTSYQLIPFSSDNVWTTETITGLNLHHGDRIAFGGKKGGDLTKGRIQISDIVVTVTEITN